MSFSAPKATHVSPATWRPPSVSAYEPVIHSPVVAQSSPRTQSTFANTISINPNYDLPSSPRPFQPSYQPSPSPQPYYNPYNQAAPSSPHQYYSPQPQQSQHTYQPQVFQHQISIQPFQSVQSPPPAPPMPQVASPSLSSPPPLAPQPPPPPAPPLPPSFNLPNNYKASKEHLGESNYNNKSTDTYSTKTVTILIKRKIPSGFI